jgi:hypothetical protein
MNQEIKSNDTRIIELKKAIKQKQNELKDKTNKFAPITNCLLYINGITYNLHVDVNEFLLVRLNAWKLAAQDIGINPETLDVSGYPITDWITDVKNKLEVEEYKKEKRKLNELEKRLTSLLSEEKQTELQIDEIEKMIGM